jgi:glycosyltransferase involved in cell wall biosynthesis
MQSCFILAATRKILTMQMPYVLITPARNEEENIERLIQSLIYQSILPFRWVIVNDGSTDRTGQIVKGYAKDHDWIELVNMPHHGDRQFASKVYSFNAGYDKVKGLPYEIIGNLDADISFEKDYFEFLVKKFIEDPNLGVAGTPFVEDGGYSSISDSFEGAKHVAGGCQLFRKECFKQIGGYIPYKAGGIDWIAVTTARMMGWRTRSFPEKVFYHHRSLGTAESKKFKADFDYGQKDYLLGNHPIWEAFRIIYRFTKKPYMLGSLMLLSGYLCAFLMRMERPISRELIAYHRDEQMRKLKAILKDIIRFRRFNKYEID